MIGPKVTGKPRFERGPITYQVGSIAVGAGNVVKAGTSGDAGKILPGTAGAIPLGVATTEGLPVGTANTGTSPSGFPMTDVMMPDENVAVARRGCFYLAALGTFALGQFVKCGAGGGVVLWVDGTDSVTLRVGQCVDPAGGTNGTPSLIDVNCG